MIVGKKSGCCGGSALRGFGATFLSTWDELYKAAAGVLTFDDALLVWSEWICGDPARRYDLPQSLLEALAAAGLGQQGSLMVSAWSYLSRPEAIRGNVMHGAASCAKGGGDGGFTVNTILDLGKKVVDTVKPIVDKETGNTTPGTTPGTTGTKPPAGSSASPFSNPTLLIGLGAAGVAAFLLLSPKKRK